MTKITIDKATVEQALEALEKATPVRAKDPQMQADAITALRTAIEAAEKQEPVAIRIPKEGDRVICIEDDSVGTVWWTAAGGGPYIKFDDGSYGQWSLREFCELFRYTTPPAAQAAPVQEPLSFNCSAGCGACDVKLQDFVTHQTQAQEGDEWVVVATEPQIVSTCCGSPVEVWDERKQDITASVDATPPAAQRQPLTPREISEFVGTHEFGPEQLRWFRFGEAAHGVTGEQK
jgi:hypothetical protein